MPVHMSMHMSEHMSIRMSEHMSNHIVAVMPRLLEPLTAQRLFPIADIPHVYTRAHVHTRAFLCIRLYSVRACVRACMHAWLQLVVKVQGGQQP